MGIVFLMTNKPQLAGSLAVMSIFVLLGLASGLPLWRKQAPISRVRNNSLEELKGHEAHLWPT